jgi:hypothetical protein
MGADRQRYREDRSRGNRHRTAGNPELPKIHRHAFLSVPWVRTLVARQPKEVLGVAGGSVAQLRSICGIATNKPLTPAAGSINPYSYAAPELLILKINSTLGGRDFSPWEAELHGRAIA